MLDQIESFSLGPAYSRRDGCASLGLGDASNLIDYTALRSWGGVPVTCCCWVEVTRSGFGEILPTGYFQKELLDVF